MSTMRQLRPRLLPAAAVVLAFSVGLVGVQFRGEADRISVRPEDTGVALINPGMGWVFHHYDNDLVHYGTDLAPSDTIEEFPGATVVYLRLAWSYLEPEEGKFDWSVVDTPAQRWISRGKQIAFRFSCSESSRDQAYATPRWVEKAGAKGYRFQPGKGIAADGYAWEPDFDDPVFLEKLDHFLAAAAARYDGNPEVAFIDIGSLGVWGEGHTYWSTRLPYTAATVRRHIDLYLKHFKHTLLAANDDFASQGRGETVLTYARNHGITLRDDSILVQPGKKAYLSASIAQDFWPGLPVILECEHYGTSRDEGYWQDGSHYLEAVEAYHASWATVHWYPREFLRENRALVDRINRRLGYRLLLVEASWPAKVVAGSSFSFEYKMRNAGVAPCLPGGYPAVTLTDEAGGIAGVFADDGFDVRSIPVGPPGTSDVSSRKVIFKLLPPHLLKPGTYSVCISVGTRTGTPGIALPLKGDDSQRRYKLGTVRIVAE
jgi:hypothetical protein